MYTGDFSECKEKLDGGLGAFRERFGMPDNFTNYVFFGVSLLLGILLLIRVMKNILAPVKKEHAVVVHKQTVEQFSKYFGNGKHTKYVVVFSVDGKKRSFYVSQFSYNGYRINEKGMLTYKGDRLIDFS